MGRKVFVDRLKEVMVMVRGLKRGRDGEGEVGEREEEKDGGSDVSEAVESV